MGPCLTQAEARKRCPVRPHLPSPPSVISYCEWQPFKFTLGQAAVINGWEVALPTMREGELIELSCAPEFAYGASTPRATTRPIDHAHEDVAHAGAHGRPPVIPPKATLIFEIELIEFKSLTLNDIFLKNGIYILLLLMAVALLLYQLGLIKGLGLK